MIEREDILDDLIARIATHPDSPIVTEDWSKRGQVDLFPAVFVVERVDNVTHSNHPRASYEREWFVSVVTFLAGSTSEKAKSELRAFQKELKKVVYGDRTRRIGNYGAGIRQQSISPVAYPPIGNNVIAQEIVFRINYREEIDRLFE